MARGSKRRINRRKKRREKRDKAKHERKMNKIRQKAERDALAAELGVDQSELTGKGVKRIGETLGAVGGAVGQALGGGAGAATESSLAAATPYLLGGAAIAVGLWAATR